MLEVDLRRRRYALPRSDMCVQCTIRDVAERRFDVLERAPDRSGAVTRNLTEIIATKNRWHVVNDRPGKHGYGNGPAGTPSVVELLAHPQKTRQIKPIAFDGAELRNPRGIDEVVA